MDLFDHSKTLIYKCEKCGSCKIGVYTQADDDDDDDDLKQ